jgi:hypothetical protein
LRARAEGMSSFTKGAEKGGCIDTLKIEETKVSR